MLTIPNPNETKGTAIKAVSLITDINKDMPWSNWEVPTIVQAKLNEISFSEDRLNRCLSINAGGESIGSPNRDGLHELANRIGFPIDFVSKLSLPTQAAVINERLQDVKDSLFTFTQVNKKIAENNIMRPDPNGGKIISNISPGWRGIVAQADIAQTAWDIMHGVYGEVNIKSLIHTDSSMSMRLTVPYDEEVSPNGRALGDVISLGLSINYRMGEEISISLFIERLVCLNGMTAAKTEFDWTSKNVGRVEDQINWMMVGIANTIGRFDTIVERSRQMAAIVVAGEAKMALLERARAMGLPRRFDDRLLEAFDAEPGNTEWHLLNAFTRMASHGGIPLPNVMSTMSSAGAWVENFDMVTARLPRPMAISSGATIIEDIRG